MQVGRSVELRAREPVCPPALYRDVSEAGEAWRGIFLCLDALFAFMFECFLPFKLNLVWREGQKILEI